MRNKRLVLAEADYFQVTCPFISIQNWQTFLIKVERFFCLILKRNSWWFLLPNPVHFHTLTFQKPMIWSALWRCFESKAKEFFSLLITKLNVHHTNLAPSNNFYLEKVLNKGIILSVFHSCRLSGLEARVRHKHLLILKREFPNSADPCSGTRHRAGHLASSLSPPANSDYPV